MQAVEYVAGHGERMQTDGSDVSQVQLRAGVATVGYRSESRSVLVAGRRSTCSWLSFPSITWMRLTRRVHR